LEEKHVHGQTLEGKLHEFSKFSGIGAYSFFKGEEML
jgi:hypothetical protein